jgi:hypothetical protein
MRLLVVGGSDAGISAGLRAREFDPGAEICPTPHPWAAPWDAVQIAATAWQRDTIERP